MARVQQNRSGVPKRASLNRSEMDRALRRRLHDHPDEIETFLERERSAREVRRATESLGGLSGGEDFHE